jgi:glycosyltransferase involved in cell wall biosynthesis
MKIAFLVHEFPPIIGGISMRAYRISKGLSDSGHEISVYTQSHPKAPRLGMINGIKVERYNLLGSRMAQFIKAPMLVMPGLFKLFGNKEIMEADLIMSFSFMMFVSFVAASLKVLRKKIFVLSPLYVPNHVALSIARIHSYGWSASPYRLMIGTSIIRSADLLLPETNMEKKDLIRFGIPQNKMEVIPDTINPINYEKLPDVNQFRQEYGINTDEKMVLYVGRPVFEKGIDHLMLAMKHVIKKVKKAKLVVIGPHLRRVSHLLRDLVPPDVRDHIVILGPVTEECKISAYSAADVFVLPSRLELFSIVILEAAAAGVPIVCTRVGVAPEIVADNHNGLFVNFGNVDQISSAIIKILTDENFKNESKNNRKLILKKYDINKEIDQYEKIFTHLVR